MAVFGCPPRLAHQRLHRGRTESVPDGTVPILAFRRSGSKRRWSGSWSGRIRMEGGRPTNGGGRRGGWRPSILPSFSGRSWWIIPTWSAPRPVCRLCGGCRSGWVPRSRDEWSGRWREGSVFCAGSRGPMVPGWEVGGCASPTEPGLAFGVCGRREPVMGMEDCGVRRTFSVENSWGTEGGRKRWRTAGRAAIYHCPVLDTR